MKRMIRNTKNVFTVSNIFFLAFIICVVAIGCGQKKDQLNLPEQEARQLKTADAPAAGANDATVNAEGVSKPSSAPSGEFKKFSVYTDQGHFKNHFTPSGWMGDYGDIKFNDGWSQGPKSRKSCIRIAYSAQKKQGAGWAGIYWQEPANNWGNIRGGYDLTGAKQITFWARGDKGGEIITEVKMGGIRGEFADTATATVGPITLTNEWKQYAVDLSGEDLSLVIGGFTVIVSAMENPDGAIFYLDDIAYE